MTMKKKLKNTYLMFKYFDRKDWFSFILLVMFICSIASIVFGLIYGIWASTLSTGFKISLTGLVMFIVCAILIKFDDNSI